MATIDDVIAALEKFDLDIVDKEWSDDIWSNNFTSCPDDLPDEFGEKFSPLSYYQIVEVIEEANKVINAWLTDALNTSLQNDPESVNSNSNTVGISWTMLQDIDCRKLLAILYFYICKGQIYSQDLTSVCICVKATSLYYMLLMIPGSNVYKVFQSSLFEKCLETFSLHKYLEIATGGKIQKAKPKKNSGTSSDEEFLDVDETLTISQQETVVKQLNFLLSTFQQLVNKFSFKKYPEAVNLCLSHLAELTRLGRGSNLQDFCTNKKDSSFAPLSRNAYLTMKDFCSSKHGRMPENIRLVLYYIMPNLTLIGGSMVPELNKYNQKELNNIRNVAISFVTDNIIPMGDSANLGITILIQQICYNMLDRADYRSKATDMILSILAKVPMNLYYTIILWIFRLSLMDGAHHRVIGIELLSKLLYTKPGTTELSVVVAGSKIRISQDGISELTRSDMSSETTQPTEVTESASQAPLLSFSKPVKHVPIQYRRVMLSIIIDRIRDEAAIVRTRALSVMGELLSNKSSPTVKRLLEEIFIDPYLESDVIDTGNGQENGFLKWKLFVTALDKVRKAEISHSMIPSGKAIVNKVFEKCMDDRVNVRKAALQVLLKIFKFSSKWMTNRNLELFGRHCRDPALSIRRDMVTNLTDLMVFFPDHQYLRQLWVKEVLPQITDREIRVQEQVLQVLTSTILSKIIAYEKMETAMDELPWKLLDSIARQKMRSFLNTACSKWKESSELTQGIIKTITTHIGTVNNAPAWLLMSCISEFVDIKSPQFVVSHYFDYVSKNVGDMGVLCLSLMTLNNSWHKLDDACKESLAKEMYKNIELFKVPPSLMRYTVEIALRITISMAENETDGKQEMAKWTAHMLEKIDSHLENCFKPSMDADKLSCRTCIAVLSLLGNLCTICPDRISNSTFAMLQDFLMRKRDDRDPLRRQLRAGTVITISKMALRNDFFARTLISNLSELLSTSTDPVILNNVIVAIADIGERYANLIEPVIPSMCVCLRSKQKIVKEIALILLIELLQEDYLKARGALVFHLLTLINDSDPITVNIVKYYFTNCLTSRHPFKMYEFFLPSLFHFTRYTKHPDFPEAEMNESERMAFDMSGAHNHRKRMNIYQFMLSNIPYMVRMKCIHFICTVILNGAADNIIPVKCPYGEQLILDALSVLVMKEIKIEYSELVKKNNEDSEEEDDQQKHHPLYKLGKQMFSEAQKKEVIETIIPICCKFKKKLHQENTKFLPYLHKFVRELVKDYKDQIDEMFKEDKQFGIEIRHELEKAANNDAIEDGEEQLILAESENDVDAVQMQMNSETLEHRTSTTSAPSGDAGETDLGLREVEVRLERDPELDARARDISESREIRSENCVVKEAVVYLEKLPPNGQVEEDHQDEVNKAVEDIANQEEALKRLSITLERLSSKYLKFIEGEKTTSQAKKIRTRSNDDPGKACNGKAATEKSINSIAPRRKFEDIDECVRKAAAKVVMPPPSNANRKKRKKSSADKSPSPNGRERKNTRKYPVSSTPLLAIDNDAFQTDISPVIDEDNDDGDSEEST